MILQFRTVLYKHASFLVLLLGGGGLYISNIVLASILSPVEYGQYGLVMAYVAFVAGFSGVGFDQLITRYAKVEGQKVSIPYRLKAISYFLVLISSVVFAFIYYNFFSYSFLMFFLLSCLSGLTLYYYTIFRLSSHFVEAQIQKNLWKLFFPVLILIGMWLSQISLHILIVGLIFLLGFTAVHGAVAYHKLDKDTFVDKNVDFSLLFGYAVSMLIMNYITLGDRFVIQKILGDMEVARFFFLQNIFLFPLTQLQTYLGFKDVVCFKSHFSLSLLHEKLIRNFIISLILSLIILLGFFIIYRIADFNSYLDVPENGFFIFLLIIMGITRVVYSSLSAAMSVLAGSREINITNIAMLIFLILGGLLLFLLRDLSISLEFICIVFLGFWLFRIATYYILLKRKANEI